MKMRETSRGQDKKPGVNNNQKTLIGSGSVYAHYEKQAGSSSIIMCPSHLVKKWKREVENLIPNARGYVVENLSDLLALKDKIIDKKKQEHSFVIMSKEDAKLSYEKVPVAVWSKSKKIGRNKYGAFVCPDCGQVLMKPVYEGVGKERHKAMVPMTKEDFARENAYNIVCNNEVKVYNPNLPGENKYEKRVCNTKLWGPLNKFDTNPKWVKLGKEGWIYKEHFQDLYDDYMARRTELDKKEQARLVKLMDKKDEIEEKGYISSSTKGVRKFSIAKYAKEKLKGKIDYLIIDELDVWLLA